MGPQTDFSAHFVLLAAPGWGHYRPLCSFACKVVKERRDIAITLLTVGDLRQQSEQEVNRYFTGRESELKGNIRIVSLGRLEPNDGTESMSLIIKNFGAYYGRLSQNEPIQCLDTGKTFEAICKPTVAIIDFVYLVILKAIRTVSGKSVLIYAWASTSTSSVVRALGPERFGGIGDALTKARRLAETTGRPMKQIIHELYYPSKGNVVNVPGLPLMYDYEWFPQEIMIQISVQEVYAEAHVFLCECDGIILTTSPAYEPESTDAVRAWYAETQRKVFAVGPLMPFGVRGDGLSAMAKETEVVTSESGHKIENFLDNTLRTRGKRSLIYISFGSLWWPKTEYVWAVVDVLIELRLPFILSHSSPWAVIPPGYAEKIEKSGLGILSTWCPQQTILNHPVTGWFLTHCGQNSVLEALSEGVPMIAWPIMGDQPPNAARLTLQLDVAFELIEVRVALGLRPLYRGVQPTGTVEAVAAEARSIFQRARGPEGERKRRNAEALRTKMVRQWDEDGDALNDLRKFLEEVAARG